MKFALALVAVLSLPVAAEAADPAPAKDAYTQEFVQRLEDKKDERRIRLSNARGDKKFAVTVAPRMNQLFGWAVRPDLVPAPTRSSGVN